MQTVELKLQTLFVCLYAFQLLFVEQVRSLPRALPHGKPAPSQLEGS